MSKPRNKSAKDIAFDKERTEFRKALREKETQIQTLQIKLHESESQYKVMKQGFETQIAKLNETIDTLSKTQNLDKESIEQLVEGRKSINKFMSLMNGMETILGISNF